jgi:dihydropteroate synthase
LGVSTYTDNSTGTNFTFGHVQATGHRMNRNSSRSNSGRRRYSVPVARGQRLALGERTLIMGVLNVTPDSFSDGGAHFDTTRAVEAGLRLVEEGADLLDIGGESTRPGSAPVPPDEEMRRVVPVIERLAGATPVFLSIDTTKAAVADAALAAGAHLVNDVSGLLYEPALGEVVAGWGAGLVLMHMRGRPADMYRYADYGAVAADVAAELREALARARAAGVPEAATLLDPGLGFAKRAEQSAELLAALDAPDLRALDRPLLVGPSRKSFLQLALGECPPSARDWGTAAAVTVAILRGAHIVRVHRVREMRQVADVADLLLCAAPGVPSP